MSEGDVWSVRQPQGTGDAGTGAAAAGPVYPVKPRRPWERGDWAWVTAGVLFLFAAISQALVFFSHTHKLSVVEPVYYSVDVDAAYGVWIAVMLTIGTLLVLRRAREPVGGLAVGFGVAFCLEHFYLMRPMVLKTDFADALGRWLTVAVFPLMVAATVFVLVVLLRQRGRGARQSRAESRVDRIVAVVLGFAGGVIWLISTVVAWLRFGFGPATSGVVQSTQCCGWSQDDSWKQVGVLVGGVTIIVFALVAATLGSKARAAGLLMGLVLAALPDVASNLVRQIAPMAGLFGLHYREVMPAGFRAVTTAMTGFWLALIALLFLSAAAVSRIALGPRKAAYPQNDLEHIAS